MRKLLYNLAVGEAYQDVQRITGPFRRRWAERWGWEYRVVDQVPESLMRRHGRFGAKFALDMFKLHHATDLLDYDLVAYSDTDTFWNPHAPDLADWYGHIPQGGFAGVQVVTKEDRAHFPEWDGDYYQSAETVISRKLDIADRDSHINGGLVLHKPREVAERWREIAEMPSPLCDEHRLCIYELQRGLCFQLPIEWNVVWRYYTRLFFPHLDWRKNRRVGFDAVNYLIERTAMRATERAHLLWTLNRVHVLHLANESWKVQLLKDVTADGIADYADVKLKPTSYYL